jgi:hydrogenase 3 maturation protease
VSESLAKLLLHRNRKILFVGVGNLLRQDDGIGPYISSRIRESDNIKVINVEVSLENYIGKINSVDHDTLVLIDCVDMKKPPGTYELMPVTQVKDLTFNTHNISLKRISEFFRNEILILAVQPENIGFGENLSYIVQDAGNKIIEIINKKEVKNGG